MPWLSYTDDEVEDFHPQFEAAANRALEVANLNSRYEWCHHVRTPGNPLVPDFVLRSIPDQRWKLAVEIKRTREAVYSTRYQIQAKSYAETSQNQYSPGTPKYFAISNLEVSLLFALNDGRPPRECRLQDGKFVSGSFGSDPAHEHRATFVEHLRTILQTVTNPGLPQFDAVWPGVISDFVICSRQLPRNPYIYLAEPRTPNWDYVRDYFAGSLPLDSSRIFLLRCLMLEYIRGFLTRHDHPRAHRLPPLRGNRASDSTANAIDAAREIDFRCLFGEADSDVYRDVNDPELRVRLREYVNRITQPAKRVVDLAKERIDSPELLDSLITAVYPVETQHEKGKVTTDPELAALLATLAIPEPASRIIDPCCGDGVLLSAAWDRLVRLGVNGDDALSALAGIEADVMSASLACIRLALKRPSTLTPETPVFIAWGDMFAAAETIRDARVVLMNPPFKRYEAQGATPVPLPLREHYEQAISELSDSPPASTGGQANLYNFYVEFIGKAVAADARLAIILDNRWYHSKYGTSLREFLLENFAIEAIVTYPHYAFFQEWAITTSILVARKAATVRSGHEVRFIRARVDPRIVDLVALSDAYHGKQTWPTDWTCRTKPQVELSADRGWKRWFGEDLLQDFPPTSWPTLPELFRHSRRGSLQKEGGGIEILEFPFDQTTYGPRREKKEPKTRRYQTEEGRKLSEGEDRELARRAEMIPEEFRGWALRRSDNINGYQLSVDDVTKDQILEPPTLREHHERYMGNRVRWSAIHDAALTTMRQNRSVNAYIEAVERIVNLTTEILSEDELWNVLREPIAGELIIPRKLRRGHRVHINPFAFDRQSRQVRLSSNFVSFTRCIAVEEETSLDRATATFLIAAFLTSSFGQLQFEMEGYNREGMLALEKRHMRRIRVFDPRWIRPENRSRIMDAFQDLPYPVAADRLSHTQHERNRLDNLIAEEICARSSRFQVSTLLDEVHSALDEWLIARQP